MHFSEDDLRNALRRKDPGPGFTQRVMARISQTEKRVPAEPRRWLAWLGAVRRRPAMAAAAAALVLAVAGWMGYEKHREAQMQQALQAEQKAILALRITSAKLNHVLKRVSEPQAQEPLKIRRQSL